MTEFTCHISLYGDEMSAEDVIGTFDIDETGVADLRFATINGEQWFRTLLLKMFDADQVRNAEITAEDRWADEHPQPYEFAEEAAHYRAVEGRAAFGR